LHFICKLNPNFMKKLLLFITTITLNLANGQVVYSDNFDPGSTNTSTSAALSSSISSNALRITGNGTSGKFDNIEYNIHKSGAATLLDITGNYKMYVKAKSSTPMTLRLDLRDELGFNSNENPDSFSTSTAYQIFEVDFKNRLLDGGYGGPCPQGTKCPVDPTKIKNLTLYFNPGIGNFNGTVDIDWISFGESLEVITTPIFLRANLVGYFKNGPKAVNVISKSSFTAKNYEVFNSSNSLVLSGTTSASTPWSDAGQNVAKIDLSSLNINGEYRVKVGDSEIKIRVLDNPLADLSVGALKYYYFNRSSTEITTENGGVWARPTGIPDTNVIVHHSAASLINPKDKVISSPGGWYDAGDYGKYIVNSGISTYTLLAAFENYKTHFENKNLNIPESTNSLPDVLDEIAWNLDWMLTMQVKGTGADNGSVYHKCTGLNFEGIVTPAQFNIQRYAIGRSTSAALNFAAVMAAASRIYSKYEAQKPGYSATLLAAARNAYVWAKANPNRLFLANPVKVEGADPTKPENLVQTGPYEDNNVADEFQWAAVELFITTGENLYKEDINYTTLTKQGVPYWGGTSTLGMLSIANNLSNSNVAQLDKTIVVDKLVGIANGLKANITSNPIETAMNNNDFDWGSNGGAANQIVVLLSAYKASNDSSYLTAAYKAIDYLLGRNAVGISYVTGFGDSSPLAPHHRISEADNVALPVPGMLVGGPQNKNNPDGCLYVDGSKAGKYSDTWCSYSTNEVTINWNAPLAYAVNALSYYTTQVLGNEDFENVSLAKNIKVYPNPVNDVLSISLNSDSVKSALSVYSIDGRLLKSYELNSFENKIDLANYEKGIYILKFKQNEKEFVNKIVKK
jgi:endoglucanase